MLFHDLKIHRNFQEMLQTCCPVLISIVLVFSACTGSQTQQNGENSTKASTNPVAPSVVMRPEDGDHFWVFAQSKDELGSGGEFDVYVDPERFPAARASFAKFGLGVDGVLPVHRHDKTEEIAYFLSGEGTFMVYEGNELREVPVRPGYVVYVPPGSWHTVKNTGKETLRLVFAVVPNEKKGLLSFFRRIGAKPGEEPISLSPDQFAKIAAEHDMVLRSSETEK